MTKLRLSGSKDLLAPKRSRADLALANVSMLNPLGLGHRMIGRTARWVDKAARCGWETDLAGCRCILRSQ
jgi:hypothetical protein